MQTIFSFKNTARLAAICLLFSGSLVSCSCATEKTPEVISIDFSETPNCNPQEIFTLAEAIPLDTVQAALIFWASKVVPVTGGYYISNQDGKVLRFNRQGKYLNSIGSLGRGPGESSRYEDFYVDTLTNQIELLSLNNQKISKFTPDGQFVSEVKIPGHSFSFTKTKEGYIFAKGPIKDNVLGEKHIYKTNLNGELITSFHYTGENNGYTTPINEESITVCDGAIFYKMWLMPGCIYRVTDTVASPAVRLNIGKLALDSLAFAYDPDKFMNEILSKHYYVLYKYLQNDRFIYLFFADEINRKLHLLYDVVQKQTLIFNDKTSVNGYTLSEKAQYFNNKGELVFIAPNPDDEFNHSLISLRIKSDYTAKSVCTAGAK